MKMMGWEEFKLMPTGTIFQVYKPHDLGELMILGNVYDNDYTEAPLLPQAYTSDVFSHPSPTFAIVTPAGFGRYGMYDCESSRYFIWGESDRERLVKWLLDPVDAAEHQNDDPHAMIDAEA